MPTTKDWQSWLLNEIETRNKYQSDTYEELGLLFGKNELKIRNVVEQKSEENDDNGGDVSSNLVLRREVLRLRNENQNVKSKLFDTERKFQDERLSRNRAESAEKLAQDTIKALTNELHLLQESNKKTEEKYLEVVAKNHDLEARIIEEKLKMAETLNSMNEMFLNSDKPVVNNSKADKKPQPSGAPEIGSNSELSDALARISWASPPTVETKLPVTWKSMSGPHGVSIPCACYSRNGTFVLTGGSDGTIQLWEPAYAIKLVDCFANVKQPVLCVSMSGGTILATSERLCYLLSFKDTDSPLVLMHTLGGNAGSIVAGKLTMDSRFAVTGGRKLKIWETSSGQCLRTIMAPSKCLSLDVNDSGTSIVTGHIDKSVRIWDFHTGAQIDIASEVHSQPITSVTFSPGGEYVITNSMDSSLALLDSIALERRKPKYFRHMEYRANPWWSRATFAPGRDQNGALFIASGSKDGALYIWDIAKDDSVYVQKAHSHPICCVTWRPDGRQLITCDSSGGIIIWNSFK